MSTPTNTAPNQPHSNGTSTYGEDRWQEPSFAASWISPPRPRRYSEMPDDAATETDHA